MHLLYLLLFTFGFGGLLQAAAAYNPIDSLLRTAWKFPRTDFAKQHSQKMLQFARDQLQDKQARDGLYVFLDRLLDNGMLANPEAHAVNLAILDRVLKLYGDLIDTKSIWFLNHVTSRVNAQDVEAVRIILTHYHSLIDHCFRNNRAGPNNVQLQALVRSQLLYESSPFGLKTWAFPRTQKPNYAYDTLRWVQGKLQHEFRLKRKVRETVEKLLQRDMPADEHAVDLAILEAVLGNFHYLVNPEKAWFQEALSQRIAAQDVEAVRILLEHFHQPALLQQCLHMNLHRNPQITGLVNRWLVQQGKAEAEVEAKLEIEEGEHELPAAAAAPEAAVPAGPHLQVFRVSAGGLFGEEARNVHVDGASGYFHVKNANRIVMGMVLPAPNLAALSVKMLDGSLDGFMQSGLFTAASRGMVLWYDRAINKATLHRIQNGFDATIPALGIFQFEDGAISFSQLAPADDVLKSDPRYFGWNVATATFPLARGNIVMALPLAASETPIPEFSHFLDGFKARVAEEDIPEMMGEGLKRARGYLFGGALYAAYPMMGVGLHGTRDYVREGTLYAAYLH
jgi:hypothetical protein